MQVTISANGKNIKAEISEEQAKILGLAEDKPKTGYERVDEDESYFVDDTINGGHEVLGGGALINNLYYINGNYYNDKTIVENNARADRLLRQLRQRQAQNGKPISMSDWKNDNIFKYYVDYDCFNELFFVTYAVHRRFLNNIYFTSEEKAKEAIEVFNDEPLWYFTEYVQRLDEVQNG